MVKAKHYLALLILIALLVLLAESQPSGNNGRNTPRRPPPPPRNREQAARQRQKNKQQREDIASSERQSQTNPTNIQLIQQAEKFQEDKTQNRGQGKNKQNDQNNNIHERSEVPATQIIPVGQKPEKEVKLDHKLQEQRHRDGDEKSQNLIKLIFIIVLGVIVLVVLLKPCFKKRQIQANSNSSTQDQIADNKYQINKFETFSQHQNHFEKIVIQEKETRIEIIKDRFLRSQNTQTTHQGIKTNVQPPISQNGQNKESTPRFGGYTFREQM